MKRGGAYDRAVRALSGVYLLIGAALIVTTVARGGGPLSVGVLVGVAFVAIGAGRLLIQRRIGGDR